MLLCWPLDNNYDIIPRPSFEGKVNILKGDPRLHDFRNAKALLLIRQGEPKVVASKAKLRSGLIALSQKTLRSFSFTTSSSFACEISNLRFPLPLLEASRLESRQGYHRDCQPHFFREIVLWPMDLSSRTLFAASDFDQTPQAKPGN